MAKSKKASLDRRGFLKSAAAGAAGATAAVSGISLEAQPSTSAGQSTTGGQRAAGGGGAFGSLAGPTERQLARDAGGALPPPIPPRTVVRPGSDVIVDALKSVGI